MRLPVTMMSPLLPAAVSVSVDGVPAPSVPVAAPVAGCSPGAGCAAAGAAAVARRSRSSPAFLADAQGERIGVPGAAALLDLQPIGTGAQRGEIVAAVCVGLDAASNAGSDFHGRHFDHRIVGGRCQCAAKRGLTYLSHRRRGQQHRSARQRGHGRQRSTQYRLVHGRSPCFPLFRAMLSVES